MNDHEEQTLKSRFATSTLESNSPMNIVLRDLAGTIIDCITRRYGKGSLSSIWTLNSIMGFTPYISFLMAFTILLGSVGARQSVAQDQWPYFYPDDPLWNDNDQLDIIEPEEVELSQYYDFIENTFSSPGGTKAIPARNVNTLNEVPNSSWFTNRHGMQRLSPYELARGSRRGSGPDVNAPWTIIRGKSEGITPGFVIRDDRGEVYFVKFDPMGHLEMATSTEAIATGFFHAIGYHVPENYLVTIDVNILEVGSEARIKDNLGRSRRMTLTDLQILLQKVPRRLDGSIRVIASKALDGKPLGHFRYYGTRPDDGNDVIPHQHRRELRGLRIFSAWLNHDDTRSINSLDIYIGKENGGYVRHYLIDFGSCLGSGSVRPQTRRAGNEYMWEAGPTFRTMATFGLWVRPYLKINYPDFPSIGRFEATAFRPESWVPEYPNPAFELMDLNDAFWAAKIAMTFTEDDIRTIVETGMLSNKEAEEYLIDSLIQRRDKTGAYYFNQINPLDQFEVTGDSLSFVNLAVKHGFERSPENYVISWWMYDNDGKVPGELISDPTSVHRASFLIPDEVNRNPSVSYCFAEITTSGDIPPGWRKPVRVFFRNSENGLEVVGVVRVIE
jgi:hypothetical protein